MRIEPNEHIVVTGGHGFLGSHLLPVLGSRYPAVRVTSLCSRDYDLMDAGQVEKMLSDLTPTLLIHLAAYSGGIEANRLYPADFFHQNLLLMENVFHAAAIKKIRKLIFTMGGCSYPKTSASPIDESQMWSGVPAETSYGYAMAKKMGIVSAWTHREQYGLDSVVLVPGNMYGEHDNYHPRDSHVIPGLIRRFFEACRSGSASVTMWGTGEPTRDFVYAGDVAQVFPHFIEHDEEQGPVNISSGTSTRIRDLAAMIAEMTGYSGEILWDASKPDGQMVKIFGVGKLKSLGLSCNTPLREGLRRTIEWFSRDYDIPGAVRL